MINVTSLLNIGKYLGIFLGTCLIYYVGYSSGSLKMESKYIDIINQANVTIIQLKDKHKLVEEKYNEQNQELLNRIKDNEIEYNNTISTIKSEYSNRLLKSEQRYNVYKRMSEQSKCESNDLPRLTSEYDRALSEGIILVRELREDIKFCRDKHTELVNQIKQLEELHNAD